MVTGAMNYLTLLTLSELTANIQKTRLENPTRRSEALDDGISVFSLTLEIKCKQPFVIV